VPRRLIRRLRDRLAIVRDPVTFARRVGVGVGRECRLIAIDRNTFGSEPYLVAMGDHVTVAAGVRFITHDGGVWVLRYRHPDIDVVGRITIGSNVFIGINTIVLPNVTIGDDCVIGAGSVVTRDVPSRTVVAGSPARVIRTLDEYECRSMDKALHIHRLNPEEKRRALRGLAAPGSAVPDPDLTRATLVTPRWAAAWRGSARRSH